MLRAVLREVEFRLLKDAHQVGELLHHVLPFAELVGVVEIREIAFRQSCIGINQRSDDLRVDLVADVALALESDHVLEARPFRDDNWWSKVVAVAVFVGDVFDEQHKQDIVLVLAGIHASAQFIAGGPERRVEIRFF